MPVSMMAAADGSSSGQMPVVMDPWEQPIRGVVARMPMSLQYGQPLAAMHGPHVDLSSDSDSEADEDESEAAEARERRLRVLQALLRAEQGRARMMYY